MIKAFYLLQNELEKLLNFLAKSSHGKSKNGSRHTWDLVSLVTAINVFFSVAVTYIFSNSSTSLNKSLIYYA